MDQLQITANAFHSLHATTHSYIPCMAHHELASKHAAVLANQPGSLRPQGVSAQGVHKRFS
jgi:hypothetical protein